MDGDQASDAPPAVIGATALGVAPLPFLAVYAILFLAHGTVHPVSPPDIGSSKNDELLAGLVATALFVIGCLATFWFLDARRRWLFALAQAAALGTSIDFVVDTTSGPPAVPILLLVTSAAALVLAFLPASTRHFTASEHSEWRRERRAERRDRAVARNTSTR